MVTSYPCQVALGPQGRLEQAEGVNWGLVSIHLCQRSASRSPIGVLTSHSPHLLSYTATTNRSQHSSQLSMHTQNLTCQSVMEDL